MKKILPPDAEFLLRQFEDEGSAFLRSREIPVENDTQDFRVRAGVAMKFTAADPVFPGASLLP